MRSEKELIIAAIDGDLDAFKQIISANERLVVHFVSRIITDENDIKDVTQDVFIKVFKNLKRFNFQSKLSTWIAQIAYTTSINYLKKNKVYVREIENSANENGGLEMTPEDLLIKKNEKDFLMEQIGRLPTMYRTVLTLFHINEHSYDEIEKITQLPAGTVKSYLFRARKQLKDNLQRYSKLKDGKIN
ncbi:RNA polymerase sigma factor [Mucilaginibacter jinjuensis]|uniref:Sigma-70 family RNA polymerase sigma factor n=1 Tax=Mucilaginibacter jinjuensis TaxID=1176721 RepID=A0ABY7TFG6_9SPHI|nr:sigma-70 family RNA polymerase sigma factor [Mucilaginibacter jinjuensis]WCT14352.1 sigma-70 family RNA polymerase sigma factor [Mucilaginibacter jinjuensis]